MVGSGIGRKVTWYQLILWTRPLLTFWLAREFLSRSLEAPDTITVEAIFTWYPVAVESLFPPTQQHGSWYTILCCFSNERWCSAPWSTLSRGCMQTWRSLLCWTSCMLTHPLCSLIPTVGKGSFVFQCLILQVVTDDKYTASSTGRRSEQKGHIQTDQEVQCYF